MTDSLAWISIFSTPGDYWGNPQSGEGGPEFFDVFGTESGEDLIGSDRWERMYGLGGNDRLYAKGGNDELYGGAGNDLLNGGEGRDLMFGGAGDDSYYVDDPGDIVSEETVSGTDDGGTDTVKSYIGFTLGDYVEKLQLLGSASVDGSGNDLRNNIKGNSGDNSLFGGGDRDTIYGYDGKDIIAGGEGRDYLYGGDDADIFVLQPEAGEWDKIYDFSSDDRLAIYGSDFGLSEGAGFTGGVLDADYFVTGSSATASGHGQFVYRADKAELLWDPDGTGSEKALRITLMQSGATLNASQIIEFGESASISVSTFGSAPLSEDAEAAYFVLKLSQPLNEDVRITFSTVDGSARDQDGDFFGISSGSIDLKAGSTTAYVPVVLQDDDVQEGTESFSLRIDSATFIGSGAAVAIGTGQASVSIVDEGPKVVAETATASLGLTDPSGIAYDPFSDTLVMVDSEVDEGPFFRAENVVALTLDGTLKQANELGFTDEPTGLTFDPLTGRMFVTDDDAYKVFAIDPERPDTVLWEFDTVPLGGNDPEDIAFDSETGNLFIVNGIDRTVIEVDQLGTQLVDSFVLAPEILDPEALAYDSEEEVFYVGGGFSDSIWKLDRDGEILEVITVLEGARSQDLNRRVNVKDIEIAPASNGSGEKHLYVADYGWSHEDDGRLIEIDPGDTGGYWSVVA
ncbi:Calx-beta domain-containing protein [Tropicimonas sediminicola]|uniref:Uncharacterized protein YjiK n=1 Tax=Tropicimonas sediminicola TaxID=1031541 RepID=A0A239LH10_9RHOB|nr:Calx-beta domain-containing protein [Tropicimonas sediminicola]SNT28834.1 Uncharacterized protein YjiK [Tropicimonas sediminicola]